jgi:hypothetical protein
MMSPFTLASGQTSAALAAFSSVICSLRVVCARGVGSREPNTRRNDAPMYLRQMTDPPQEI